MSALRKLLDNFRGNTGLRGPILKLLSGSGYASIAGYLGMLILVRLFPKDAWAINDAVISLVGVLAPLVSLRYEDALMLAEDKRDAAHAFLLAGIATLSIAAILWVVLPLVLQIGILKEAPEELAAWIWVVPVILICFRFAKIAELWLLRLEDFDRVPVGQMAQMSAMVVSRIGAGFVTNNPGGLIYGYMIGWLASLLVFGKRVLNSMVDAIGEGFSFERLKFIAVRYRRFPAYTMPAAMVSALGIRLPVLAMTVYFTLDTVAEYGRAVNLLFVPLSFLGVAIGQVFFVRAVKAYRRGVLYEISATIHNRMVMLALLPTLVLIVAGPDIFAFLLGAQWRPSGEMVQYLAPWIFFTAVSSPLTRLFDVMERQRLELILHLAILFVIALSMAVGIYFDDVPLTLILLGACGGLIRLTQIIIVLSMADVDVPSILYPYTRYGLYALPWLIPVWVGAQWFSPFLTTLCAAMAGAGYLAVVIMQDGYFHDDTV